MVRYAGEQIFEQANNINNLNVFGSILYNVKAYGARGDGVVDDTARVQATIDAAAANGGIVFFPAGTYKTGSFTVPSNVTLSFSNGAMLSVVIGSTVTINGPIDAELTQIFAGLGTVSGSMKVPHVYPKWWGAIGDGINDDAASIQAAINAASSAGGGTVFFPPGNYYTTGVLTVPTGVKLFAYGGINDGNNLTQILNDGGATFYITNTVSPFITITGQSVTIEGLCFYYPNQVSPAATVPVVYPVTITHGTTGGPGTHLNRLTFINAYAAIKLDNVNGGAGRARIENINLGCLSSGIEIDNALDVVRLRNIQITPFYSVGNVFPTNLDTWVMQNGRGIMIGRADEMIVSDIFIFGKFTGILLKESTNLALSPVLGSYGVMSNITMDFVNIGISCKNTNIFGWDIVNCHIAAIAPGGSFKTAIVTTTGGTMTPYLRFNGGSLFGASLSYVSHSAGYLSFQGVEFNNNAVNAHFNCASSASVYLSVINCDFIPGGSAGVFGINNVMGGLKIVNNSLNGNASNLIPGTNIPANANIRDNDFKFGVVTPSLPANNAVYTNNLGIPVRVFVSGGTVSAIAIRTVPTGLTSGSFLLDPQDSITLTYTVAPTWVWLGF